VICGKCGKGITERVYGGWHEFSGCDCPPREYRVSPGTGRVERRPAPTKAEVLRPKPNESQAHEETES